MHTLVISLLSFPDKAVSMSIWARALPPGSTRPLHHGIPRLTISGTAILCKAWCSRLLIFHRPRVRNRKQCLPKPNGLSPPSVSPASVTYVFCNRSDSKRLTWPATVLVRSQHCMRPACCQKQIQCVSQDTEANSWPMPRKHPEQ